MDENTGISGTEENRLRMNKNSSIPAALMLLLMLFRQTCFLADAECVLEVERSKWRKRSTTCSQYCEKSLQQREGPVLPGSKALRLSLKHSTTRYWKPTRTGLPASLFQANFPLKGGGWETLTLAPLPGSVPYFHP